MCLVHPWNTRLAAMCKAVYLSQNSKANCVCSICKSLSKVRSHTSSQVTFTKDRYSALADDLDIVCYFFDFHKTKKSPMKIQKPPTDFLLPGQEVQSEFANPLVLGSIGVLLGLHLSKYEFDKSCKA